MFPPGEDRPASGDQIMSTDSSSDRDPVERLAEEYLGRRRNGEHATIDEYADRYPEWADRIHEAFPALEMMERLKPASGEGTGSFNGEVTGFGGGPPDRLGDYRILREIGRGGMGVVYEAVQESLGRHVALKVLPMHGQIDPVQMERFRLEARSAAKLHHTHIVPVHGVGEHGGVHYYAMQFIQGCGLDSVLDDLRRLRPGAGPPPAVAITREAELSRAAAQSLLAGGSTGTTPNEGGQDALVGSCSGSASGSGMSSRGEPSYYRAVARIGVQVAEALAHAHSQGVLHRDIKPSNLLLDADGEAWVTDFGLAKVEGSDGPTRTGDFVGTLRYMAPERFEGWSDPRSDVYGLGVTLYELLTLHPAYEAETRAILIERVLHASPPAPRRHDSRIPRDLETIVQKSIAKEPAERYATGMALAEDLRNYLAGKPIQARRVGLTERAWRWSRRNPAATGLVGVSLVALMALTGAGVSALDRAKVQLALRNEQRAFKNESSARKSEAAIRYFNDMIMAEREWSSGNVRRVELLLDEWDPKPGQNDARGWEWHYLNRLRHKSALTLTHSGGLYGVAYSPDRRYLVSAGGLDQALKIWDASSGRFVRSLPHVDATCVVFSSDGKYLASSGGQCFVRGKVKLWDTATWEELPIFPVVTGWSSSVAFHPDGSRLAVASGELENSNRVSILEIGTGKRLGFIDGDVGGVLSVEFSPDGKRIATACGHMDSSAVEKEPSVALIRDAVTLEVLQRLEGHTEPLTSVAFSPDGTKLATSSLDLTVRVWDAASAKEIRKLIGHGRRPNKVVFSPNGKWLAAGTDGTSITVWEVETGKEINWIRGHTAEVYGLAFDPDSRRLASSSNNIVKVWDLEPSKDVSTLRGHDAWVSRAVFSPDGKLIATASIDRTIKVWDPADGQCKYTLVGHTEPIFTLDFSPDGTTLASGGGNWKHIDREGEIRVWDLATRKEVRSLHAHVGLARALAFSPDGRQLASVGGERTFVPAIRIWDVKTWQERPPLKGHTLGLTCIAYSRDGRLIASAGFDNTVKIWDAGSGREIRTLEGHTDGIFSVAFSPDGKQLASCSQDGNTRLWDPTTGQGIRPPLPGRHAMLNCLSFSPDGKRLAIGDYVVTIRDVATGLEALALDGHSGLIWSVAFSPDGHRIASTSQDGTVRIWDGTPLDAVSTKTSGIVKNREIR
jgi:eukaryotic-like serine/threonine-protein kinase